MEHLGVNRGRAGNRRRGLSINSITQGQEKAMNSAIDNLESDISLVRSQWHNVLTGSSNPLELALAFLDDTSVGLQYRYPEFTQLEDKIATHLQEVVNEHSQAFNANVASYSKTVMALTDAQDKTSKVNKNVNKVNELITMEKGALGELNQTSLKYSSLICSLSSIEELLQLPEKIEDNIRKEEYAEILKLIQRGFQLLNQPDMKPIKHLQQVKQQIELQEHTLFENMIQEINSIIYSTNTNVELEFDILKTISISQNGFTSLENYLYNIASIDLPKQSSIINNKLDTFIDSLHNSSAYQDGCLSTSEDTSGYARLFTLFSIIKGINRLPTALSILNERNKQELHNIILTATDKVRTKHPTLLKKQPENADDESFGLSVRDLLSLVIRECFWEIFLKFLLAIQGHRAVFEISNVLQPNVSSYQAYSFDVVWRKLFDEIQILLTRYLTNSNLLKNAHTQDVGSGGVPDLPDRKNLHQIFSLQNNIEDNTEAKHHTNELKSLLKDIFLGFTVTSNMNMDSVYVHDETFEQEEPLIMPSVFNLKMILEPFLFFSQGSSKLLPETLSKDSTPSLVFFNKYMDNHFYPQLKLTMDHLFISKVESNNPFAVELLDETKLIMKSAAEFQKLFFGVIYVSNTSNVFRPQMVDVILNLLTRFYHHNLNIFESLLNNNQKLGKNMITTWLQDEQLLKLEEKIIEGSTEGTVDVETEELFKYCPEFYLKNNRLRRGDFFNEPTFDSLVYLTNTLCWVLSWLPALEQRVDSFDEERPDANSLNANELREKWAFFEYSDEELYSTKMSTTKLLLNNETSAKFCKSVDGLSQLRLKSMALLRFDIRSRCIYSIGKLFMNAREWKLDAGSNELDENISSLISQMKNIENKLNRQLSEKDKDTVFTGIDIANNIAFIKGASGLEILNGNGTKRMIRNINVLQHGTRNMYHETANIALSRALLFYSLIDSDPAMVFNKIEEGLLQFCSVEDLKNILRLQFSEELNRQKHTANTKSAKPVSQLTNRRYEEAMKKLISLGGDLKK
ncbi:exocyst subunit SEC8 KNAG_0H00780 [Huiozyma naganishii CBS 8797]|uniref:Exocyst complex component Sec8 n=1 Tax=Huiozyma naganishii (strain ATCC MYA-139 / BCRC 22969 / CBS 8797 / KCTC 17520 / NBRC 10181 / NCYC 3082 / Yp74L-3) TaxID=1071383 RepID=J7RPA1_HUIN7|nr:hypothetical protein KNAG_0H00780 [Kazachstania naganishii CBS 8797]CCK71493.1 hypothetical protein KNAG_0H00780 [Kazachstania naganishii CBS 8797]